MPRVSRDVACRGLDGHHAGSNVAIAPVRDKGNECGRRSDICFRERIRERASCKVIFALQQESSYATRSALIVFGSLGNAHCMGEWIDHATCSRGATSIALEARAVWACVGARAFQIRG